MDNCVICLEKLTNTNNIILSCNHKYHLNCIILLIIKNIIIKCPLCKIEIKLPDIFKIFENQNKLIKDLEEKNSILLAENEKYKYFILNNNLYNSNEQDDNNTDLFDYS